jgi:hypothetical protein
MLARRSRGLGHDRRAFPSSCSIARLPRTGQAAGARGSESRTSGALGALQAVVQDLDQRVLTAIWRSWRALGTISTRPTGSRPKAARRHRDPRGAGELGAVPVEADTDGVYFVPPPDHSTAGTTTRLLERLTDGLPSGIQSSSTAATRRMFSYKMKTYALLDERGA